MSFSAVTAEDTVAFHGVPVRLAYPELTGDPLRPLLTGFGAAGPSTRGIVVELSARGAPAVDSALTDFRPSFCHGRAQGYTSGSRHRLSDGTTTIDIDPERGLVRGVLGSDVVSELAGGMLHVAFCLLLREHGIFDLHAAGACFGDHTLLLVGDAGSGKTTALLALLGAGAQYLGDDRVLLRRTESDLELLGYPRDFHLTARTLEAYPELERGGSSGIDGKARLDPRRAFVRRFCPSACGRVTLLSASVRDQPVTTLSPLGRAESLGTLLSASASVGLEVLPHRSEQLELLAQLASSALAFEAHLGRDILLDPIGAAQRLLDLLRGGT